MPYVLRTALLFRPSQRQNPFHIFHHNRNPPSPYILRINPMFFPIFPDILSQLIPLQRFSHIESILSILPSRRIITIITHHSTINAITVNRKQKASISILVLLLFPDIRNSFQQKGKKKNKQRSTHPIPLYISIATLLLSRTNRSTNQAWNSSPAFSSDSVNRLASPNRLAEGATVRAVMCACHGR